VAVTELFFYYGIVVLDPVILFNMLVLRLNNAHC